MDKNKKIVVITGVSHGIGEALAQEYLNQGSSVFGCARSKVNMPNLNFTAVDVRNNAEVKSWADEIVKNFGAPKILINNAAIINKNAPLWQIPVEDFDKLIDINIKGVVNVLRAFVPFMLEDKGGTIVNMSSGWGKHGSANVSSYCASKFAVEGLTQSLAEELPKNFIVVALSPGIVKTNMLKSCAPENYSLAPEPQKWAKKAITFINNLKEKDNGSSLRCVVD